MKEKIRFIFYILVVIVFLICGLLVVTYAAGYKIDFNQRQISQTGLIDIQTETPETEIFFDNQLVGKGSVTLRNLEAKDYKIEIKKEGYHDWTKNINLKTGEAIILNGIILFRENPGVEKFNFNLNGGSLSDLSDRDNLIAKGGEIYQNSNLVSRFTNDINGLCWYTDHHYLAFTQDNKLKIIETDGSNLIDLLDKSSSSPVIFVNGGRYVIFENDKEIFRAEIR